MKLISKLEPLRLTLDEVYQLAQQEGRPEIGGIGGAHYCSIKMEGVGPHYISICSKRFPTAVQNLAACVEIAKTVREALK